MAKQEARDAGLEDGSASSTARMRLQGAEIVLALGGDGTFLRAAELPARPGCRCWGSTSATSDSWPRPTGGHSHGSVDAVVAGELRGRGTAHGRRRGDARRRGRWLATGR